MKQKILMCAPDFFGVDYVINPWMKDNRGKADRPLAQKQWNNLREVLAKHVDIVLVEPQPGLPDLVFTANAGMVLGKKAVVSRFRSKERQGEEPFFHKAFVQAGFAIEAWPQDVFFEGAGDALFNRAEPLIWSGFGFRSDEQSAALLERIFGQRTVALRLVDPRFYHLDTCLCPLTGGFLMYYPPAFDAASQAKIADIIPPEKRITVAELDALAFACNAVDLETRIVLNAATPGLQEKLRDAGFATIQTPLSEFLKAGGTAKCLTLKLHES